MFDVKKLQSFNKADGPEPTGESGFAAELIIYSWIP